MHCICADGGTLNKHESQHRRRFSIGAGAEYGEGEESSSNSSCIADHYEKMSLDRRSRRRPVMEPKLDTVINIRNSRERYRTNIHTANGTPGQQSQSFQYSSSSTSSSGASALVNGGHFSRRRRSLVEALSNPVSSTRSSSPESPERVALYCGRSATPICLRPSSSVVPRSNANRDSENRLFAVDEVIRCERDYVSLLSALHEGFLKPACQNAALFDGHLLRAIFGNLHQLRFLHEKLLADLENAVVKSPICLGSCFLHHVCTRPTFETYSHYCNNHQRSCRRLSTLYEHESYKKFFEECRRICRLPTLRLDAFLLRPVQQLCRYPLLLATLLQHTPKAHQDHKALSAALQATQQLLTVVNNRRRLFEQLQELARWQKTVADWKGPDLLQTSSRLIYNGELACTCYTIGESMPRWRQRVSVFLFDRLLVLCSKDRLKKQLVFKNRFSLDGTNRPSLLSGGAWQITAPSEGKRLLLKANSKQEAKLWLEALNKERCLVQQSARLPTNDEKLLALEMSKDPEA